MSFSHDLARIVKLNPDVAAKIAKLISGKVRRMAVLNNYNGRECPGTPGPTHWCFEDGSIVLPSDLMRRK
jgi:hypothetical protein